MFELITANKARGLRDKAFNDILNSTLEYISKEIIASTNQGYSQITVERIPKVVHTKIKEILIDKGYQVSNETRECPECDMESDFKTYKIYWDGEYKEEEYDLALWESDEEDDEEDED